MALREVWFVAEDGEGEETIWHQFSNEDQPMPALRRCDLHPDYRAALWSHIVRGLP